MLHHQVYRSLNRQELSSLATRPPAPSAVAAVFAVDCQRGAESGPKGVQAMANRVCPVRSGLPGDALPLLQVKVFNKPADMVIVMFGAEAAWDERRRQATELSPADFQSQLNELVTAVQKESTKVVLMPPLLPDTRPDDVINRDRRIKSFAASVQAVAAEHNAQFIDSLKTFDLVSKRKIAADPKAKFLRSGRLDKDFMPFVASDLIKFFDLPVKAQAGEFFFSKDSQVAIIPLKGDQAK